MTNISRNPLSTKKQKQLFEELGHIISSLGSSDIQLFLGELLGKEEQIMIAKRFSAIILLERDFSEYRTAKILHLSATTVSKLNSRRELGQYKSVLKWLQKDKHRSVNFFKLLDSILTVGGIMPHYGEQSKSIRRLK